MKFSIVLLAVILFVSAQAGVEEHIERITSRLAMLRESEADGGHYFHFKAHSLLDLARAERVRLAQRQKEEHFKTCKEFAHLQARILEAPEHNAEGNRDSSYFPL